MAKACVTALTLLDLSAAFNTIDHTILLDRLNVYYGVSELAHSWFKSYLLGRTHSCQGRWHTLTSGCIPVWGRPGLDTWSNAFFSLYTYAISSIIHSHSCNNYHFYTNDTQLYTLTSKFLSLETKIKELPKQHSKFHVHK